MLEPPTGLTPSETPRPVDALLAGYVAGALGPHLHALVESHLILSGEHRDVVRAMEAQIGEEIEQIEHRPYEPAARDAVLGAIYAGGWYGRPKPEKFDPDVPEPLDRLIGMSLAQAPWRFAAAGVLEHVVFADGTTKASLLKIAPGRGAPRHTHSAMEATLVSRARSPTRSDISRAATSRSPTAPSITGRWPIATSPASASR
ncbi:hypothetical protein [Chenggangzhangella methanolivorans]|uniref:hypothetical protein n=1 Tax=Chenggangzhangella methanolivorans TaxID=1437009 RepID=UPI0021BD7F9D|nr:hypothetical protein [Chenggangzhangella methanolivorans]